MLILLRADPGDSFSAVTGLLINLDKSTMVPMHTPDHVVAKLKEIFGCRVEGFPQTYLELPLSSEKLHLFAFSPLISKADKYLGGWQASLLNPMGRVVLANTVLDSQLVHAMQAMRAIPSAETEEAQTTTHSYGSMDEEQGAVHATRS